MIVFFGSLFTLSPCPLTFSSSSYIRLGIEAALDDVYLYICVYIGVNTQLLKLV